jgi:hypothetical protein
MAQKANDMPYKSPPPIDISVSTDHIFIVDCLLNLPITWLKNCDLHVKVRTSTVIRHFSMWCIRAGLFLVLLLPLEQVLEAEVCIVLKELIAMKNVVVIPKP